MDTRTEALLKKIRALRAKAEDPSVTEAEAALFAAKVAELLAIHGLEEAQLEVDEQTGIEHEDYVNEWISPARRLLAIAVCKLYMVKPIIDRRKRAPWTLIGRKHNIIIVKEMTSYLIKTVIRLSNDYKRKHGGNHIDFRRGCFERLIERIDQMRREQARAAAPQFSANGNPQNMPALYLNENALLKQYMNERFQTKTAKFGGIRVGDDGQAGRRAADGISLNSQIGSGKRGSTMLLTGGRK